ncbi:SWI5-dependent HO expression protein 4 [Coemansia pectinata]|uniref:SWI5-dependent HO expression protein 4 n=1 Tax=Coemansia pectinata TaxID=1052879 RepID=A0A9W8LCC9_9FUNG|nr:SWI5-dependent HO expression protein 4 [Coemansia pectinata]
MTSSPSSSKQTEVERITKELQAGAQHGSALELLLQRAQLYADLGNEDKAKSDISQAAALAREPDASAASVAAVEKAFRKISVSNAGGLSAVGAGKYATHTNDAIVDSVVKFVAESLSPEDSARDIAEAVGVLSGRIAQSKRGVSLLTESQLCQLVDAFHTICERVSLAKDQDELAAALAGSVRSALSQLAVPIATSDGKEADISSLVKVAAAIAETWERHQNDGHFKQQTCRLGAALYTTAAYALSTHEASQNDSVLSEVVRRSFAFCVSQLWLVGTLPVATVDEYRDVGQGILRLLTANRPLFLSLFVTCTPAIERLLTLLGQPSGSGRRSMAMLIASQLVASAKDPSNSSHLPGYEPPTARGGAPALALTKLQQCVVRVLDSWVQSTAQAERTQGLLAIAALYESGVGSDLVAELWLQSGWVGELWDQGDVDLKSTQLALLALADASSSDAAVGPRMKKAGNGLVQELVRKGSSKSATSEDRGLAELAAVVLAKWSGVASTPAAAPEHGVVEAVPTEDADPMVLADMHMQRIIDLLASSAEPDCAAVERATEALGYLCLQPKLKEHVAQNESLLKGLFSFATKSTVASLKFSVIMLVRNLTQYRVVLTEEQKRMRQLQQMGAKAQNKAASAKPVEEEDQALDAPERVSARAQLVSKAGAVSLLVSAVQPRMSPSDSVRDAVAEIAVALATTQGLRGLLVQQGGVRALLSILTSDAPKASAAPYAPQALVQSRDKHVAFALAKIAISVPPHLAFADPRELVRLLLSLLLEDTDAQALLMKFEALLALTNLASAQPGSAGDVRGYLANDLNGFAIVEMCVLSEHPLVRRAATELVCNLVYDPQVFEKYAANSDRGIPDENSRIIELPSDDEDVGAYRSQRLHLLVALADVEDVPTRSAAAGALAVLSSDPRCCRYLFLVHPRAADVLVALADDNGEVAPDFKHRVAVVWANAASCGDTRVADKLRQQGVVESLQGMANDSNMPYYAAAKSALESLSPNI